MTKPGHRYFFSALISIMMVLTRRFQITASRFQISSSGFQISTSRFQILDLDSLKEGDKSRKLQHFFDVLSVKKKIILDASITRNLLLLQQIIK